MSEPICSECGKECKAIQDYFECAGTHCTNGKDGKEMLDEWNSDCCSEEVIFSDEDE